MKTFTHILLVCICFSALFCSAQSTYRKLNPDQAKYFIKGDLILKKTGKNIGYYLQNTTSSSNISYDYEQVKTGTITEEEDVRFVFTNASTDYPGGFSKNQLQFWRYDSEIGEWQEDRETRQGNPSFEKSKIMTLMLIIDCSTSLGAEDLNKAKSDATYFLDRLYALSNMGNIKVGIIGFSKLQDTKIFDIASLDANSLSQMKSFINSFELSNGTALYYSMDMGFEMMKRYVKQNKIEKDKYAVPLMITFTDGLDQTSTDINKDILTADQYLEYVSKNVTNASILNQELVSYIVGLKGKDITSDNQMAKFEKIGKRLSNDHYKTIGKIDELRNEFERIVIDLTERWSILNCYVPKGFQGKVGWTFGEIIPKETPPVANRKVFVGFNFGIGSGIGLYHWHKYTISSSNTNKTEESYSDVADLEFSIGLSVAWPIKKHDNLAIGGYLSYCPIVNFTSRHERYYERETNRYGYATGGWNQTGTKYDGIVSKYGGNIKLGALFITGDYTNGRAFMCGVGLNFCAGPVNWSDICSANLRIGAKCKGHWYWFFDGVLGATLYGGFNIGYSL